MSIEVEAVSFSYGTHKVIEDCSFIMQKGKMVCLLGRNGSGKTTLLRLLNGSLNPERGRVQVDGLDVHSCSRQHLARLIAFVPQSHEAVFAYTAIDMVVMGRNPHMRFFTRPNQEDYAAAEDALKQVGIIDLKDRYYMDMSGGERQLVFLARALAQQASYYVLDEPTSHLDYYNQHIIMKTLRKIVEVQSCSVLIAMHDPNLALSFADGVVLMQQGRILGMGDVEDTMTSTNLSDLYNMNLKVVSLEGKKIVVDQ